MATWGNPDGLTRKFCNLPGGEVIELPLDKDYEGKLPEVFLNDAFKMILSLVNRYRTEKKVCHRTVVCPFVDISLRASFHTASHFSTDIRAREFAWP